TPWSYTLSLHDALPISWRDSAHRALRRRSILRGVARELPVGHLHAKQPVARRARRRCVHRAQALGLPRPADHRRAHEAAPCAATAERSGSGEARGPAGRARRIPARHHLVRRFSHPTFRALTLRADAFVLTRDPYYPARMSSSSYPRRS